MDVLLILSILPFRGLLPPSLTPGYPSVFQFYFRLTCGIWTCDCWVSASAIFFLGPHLFSHCCLLPKLRQRAVSCTRVIGLFQFPSREDLLSLALTRPVRASHFHINSIYVICFSCIHSFLQCRCTEQLSCVRYSS